MVSPSCAARRATVILFVGCILSAFFVNGHNDIDKSRDVKKQFALSRQHLERRTLSFGPHKRMHRLTRRLPPMPKPDGTDGAANDDAANLKLLKTFADELSAMNTEWQKTANKELLNGQTVEDFDTFAHRIEKEKSFTSTVSTDNEVIKESDSGSGQKEGSRHQHETGPPSVSSKASQQQQQPTSQILESAGDKKPATPAEEKKFPQTPKQTEEQPKPQNPPHQQPQSKSKSQPQPQPQPEPKPKPKQEPKAKEKPSGGSGLTAKYSGQTFAGSMTYYDVGLDACGNTDKKSDFIVAVAQEWFDEFSGGDSNPNHNKICGQTINISKNGKSTQAKIFDICPGCDRLHIDMSEDLFKYFEDLTVGECDVSWGFA